jgi:rifampicin phosphotransferase
MSDAVSFAVTWTHDPSHYPEPMTPLSADVWFDAMGHGIRAAAKELRAPFGGFETMTHAGGWAYEHDLEPEWTPDPATLRAAALDVAERWERELKAAAWAITDELRAMRPERPDEAGAIGMLDRLVSLVREQWRIHFLVVIPVHASREVLHDAWVERFGKQDELEPYRLIEGLPNETLEADEMLWEVAGLARRLDVADVILELPGDAALGRLALLAHGREVLHAMQAYLLRFGGRSRLHELSEPRDAERPAAVLESIRLFLEHPRDLPSERAQRASARDRLEADTLARVSDRSERAAFAELIARVTQAVPLEESHAYHIDYPGLQATREALLGFGRRLVAEGGLDSAHDVFLLRLEELRGALLDPWSESLSGVVGPRRTEMEAGRARRPERVLGPAPDESAEVPPMLAKFYGDPAAAATSQAGVVRGTPASPGNAAGPARVVAGPEDFARVQAGDIVVCATTTPAWTPLFAAISGLVTDTGGILCHAAVIAREYGLPAIVGTQSATQLIPDGALVELDASSGEARVVDVIPPPRG